MADTLETGQERTESPTPRRRDQARKQGRVARSPELVAAIVLFGGGLLLSTWGGQSLASYARRVLTESGHTLSGSALTPVGAVAVLRATITGLVLALLPFALGVTGLAIGGNVLQTRGAMSWTLVRPKWTNVSPMTGLKRLFGPDSAFNLIKSSLKLLALGVVTWIVLSHSWGQILSLGDTGADATALVLRSLLVRLVISISVAFIVVSALDYAFQWFRLEKSLRMTRQEVVREHRETEGDPLIKARMLTLARQRARQRMMQRVPHADVVVVNPTHIAVALRYDIAVGPAPIVVAMGQRKLAERIKAIALKAGVPVIENRPVARALFATSKVGQAIPPALYAAIAEILAFVYRTRAPHRLAALAEAERRAR
jgi:flagellar biosynthetic protein FlhB